MISRIGSPSEAQVTLPRGMLIADAWSQLGAEVAPLSNASGRPLARTVKLILDPLVLRPTYNPQFSGGSVGIGHVDELRRTISDAGPALAATAAWFVLLKKARRRAAITEGNPQDLYFQRCFELAHLHGRPGEDAERIAAEAVDEVQQTRGVMTVDRLRHYVTDPRHSTELTGLLRRVWQDREVVPATAPPLDRLEAFLDTCATAPDKALLSDLVAGQTGTGHSADLDTAGVAHRYGLTTLPKVSPPSLGDKASKTHLPWPFDRSILERIFAGFTSMFQRESMDDIPSMVVQEIHRSAAAWQLAEEPSRVAMALGREASRGLGAGVDAPPGGHRTDAHERLGSRWRREAFVHRVLRLPNASASGVPQELREEIRNVERAYLRRLWVRLHGRELRRDPIAADTLWDVLDGVLRSVIMDQRDRLKGVLERGDRT